MSDHAQSLKPAKITLFRHGGVDFDLTAWCSSTDLRQLVVQYDVSPLEQAENPQVGESDELVFASSLRRSMDTAKLLFGRVDLNNEIFGEAELPDLFAISIRLPIGILFILARMAWWLGRDKKCESHLDFRLRANEGAVFLDRHAKGGRPVLLVGHALLNRAVAKELLRLGYRGPKTIRGTHLSSVEYVSLV